MRFAIALTSVALIASCDVYHPDQQGTYGDDLPWDLGGIERAFEPGRWHQVEHRIVMSSSPGPDGPRDGVIEGWLDGELALQRDDLRFRYADAFAVDALYFRTFFGGNDPDWAPSTDQEICFDDVVIATAPITH